MTGFRHDLLKKCEISTSVTNQWSEKSHEIFLSCDLTLGNNKRVILPIRPSAVGPLS